MSMWKGYFVCPNCGKQNPLLQWMIKEGDSLILEFETTSDERCLVFACPHCGAKVRFGIKKDDGGKSMETVKAGRDLIREDVNDELIRAVEYSNGSLEVRKEIPFNESFEINSRPSWHEYFMEIAKLVARRSTCLKRKVGAVAIDPQSKQILATGYNGAASGSKHCSELGCLRRDIPSGERFELCRAVHAEANLLCQAARRGVSLIGAWVYCTHKPCYWCMKQLINAGITKVIYEQDYPHDKLVEELISQKLIQVEKYGG